MKKLFSKIVSYANLRARYCYLDLRVHYCPKDIYIYFKTVGIRILLKQLSVTLPSVTYDPETEVIEVDPDLRTALKIHGLPVATSYAVYNLGQK